ncbi:MAG: GNAT family N-acetyltransferase [Pyrinomonadaceae bacterium]|nr:GNAT family N-acetyltransferase [Pyrinomonadaceae bacterium]
MNVRKAVKEDAENLIDFNQKMAFETEGKKLDPQKIKNGVEAVFADDRKGFYIVAENDHGEIAGGLMVTYEWSDWRNAWFWWIQSVYVVPEFRGNHIYSAMYDHVRTLARESGDVCGFRLYVETENSKAQKVYEKCGMHRSHYLMFESESE